MRTANRLLFSALLTGALLMLAVSVPLHAQTLKNGGFESSTVGDITATGTTGWLVQVSGVTPPPVFEIVSDTVQEGSRALKVTLHGLGVNQWDMQTVADSIQVVPGVTYTYSIWARSQRPGATVNFTVGNYSYSEYGAIRPATLNTFWTRYTMQFTVNDSKTVIRAPIHFYGAVDTGNAIFIDNLQILDPYAGKRPVIAEAEAGVLGSNVAALHDSATGYVDVANNAPSAGNPGDTSRVLTLRVQFADSGRYNLYARVRVQPGGSTASFFYGKGFGTRNSAQDTDWVGANGLAAAGFSDPTAFVAGPGTAGTGVWKWINLSKNSYGPAAGQQFTVTIDSLTKTLQIGGGNTGLDIDKLAFGKAAYFFSVANLDKGLMGVTDTTLIYNGPPLAAGMGKFLGNAEDVPTGEFARYWTQLTPGNAGKWGSVAGSTDTSQWNWKALDSTYNYAISHHLKFKEHTLVWGAQQPSWISSQDSATQFMYIDTWFRMVAQRYPLLDMVDVVNEALPGHNPPDGAAGRANYIKGLGGKGTTGWDWLVNAFKLARKYFPPKAKLLINDYGIINDNNATSTYLGLINLLKGEGVIDGIGVQGHRFELESADTNVIKGNLDKLAGTGLPVYITEFDLGNLGNTGAPNDNQQLQLYQKVFPILWRHPGVKGITLWGYVENQMWQTSCYLLRVDGTARPAFLWLAQFVKDNPLAVPLAGTALPSAFALEQNFPNPFNPTTTIRYRVPAAAKVTLQLFDVLGREVQTLVNTVQAPGTYDVTVDGRELSTGVYFYRITAGDFTRTMRLLLLK